MRKSKKVNGKFVKPIVANIANVPPASIKSKTDPVICRTKVGKLWRTVSEIIQVII